MIGDCENMPNIQFTSDDLMFKDIKFNMIDFQMTRPEFYRLPQWKRNDLKKRVKLF